MYEGGRTSVLIIIILFRNCKFQEIYLIKPRNAFFSVLISSNHNQALNCIFKHHTLLLSKTHHFVTNYHVDIADIPLEMNLFSETDNNAKNEHLNNILCSVDDTAVATTQVHSNLITNEESTNIWGIIQNVTCFVLNMDQCITANITLQLRLKSK